MTEKSATKFALDHDRLASTNDDYDAAERAAKEQKEGHTLFSPSPSFREGVVGLEGKPVVHPALRKISHLRRS